MYILCTLIPHATLLTAWSVSSQSKSIKSFFATYLPSELSLNTSCSTQQSAETLHGSASASRPQTYPNWCIIFVLDREEAQVGGKQVILSASSRGEKMEGKSAVLLQSRSACFQAEPQAPPTTTTTRSRQQDRAGGIIPCK